MKDILIFTICNTWVLEDGLGYISKTRDRKHCHFLVKKPGNHYMIQVMKD